MGNIWMSVVLCKYATIPLPIRGLITTNESFQMRLGFLNFTRDQKYHLTWLCKNEECQKFRNHGLRKSISSNFGTKWRSAITASIIQNHFTDFISRNIFTRISVLTSDYILMYICCNLYFNLISSLNHTSFTWIPPRK